MTQNVARAVIPSILEDALRSANLSSCASINAAVSDHQGPGIYATGIESPLVAPQLLTLMASLNIAQALLASYPEANPFDADPPPYNLTPYSRETELHWDTPEFVAAALDISERSGNNPLRHMYGTNPMVLTDYRARNLNLPLSAYTPPPPLQKTSLPSDATFLERIHPHCHEVLVTIRVDGEVRLLKIVRSLVLFPRHTF